MPLDRLLFYGALALLTLAAVLALGWLVIALWELEHPRNQGRW